MRLQAPHCPSCGAPIDVPAGVPRVSCTYCAASLVVEEHRVSAHRTAPPPRGEEEKTEPYPEPDATLWTREAPRFELSAIEQRIPGAVPEIFSGVELGEERFALVLMRVVDKDGAPVAHPLEPAFEALKASLETDGDPGLAGNLALEALCKKPFEHRLECAVVLFEPRHMRVTPWAAGMNEGLTWASSEEGRSITLGGGPSALERKMLREARDHFANGRPVHLAASDLVIVPSAGFVGRGGRGYGNGLRALYDVANEHLGEEPLRIVTLAKNAFWEDFQKNRQSRPTPVGDVRIAAVRAILPPLAAKLPEGLTVRTLRSRKFELALCTRATDGLKLVPLHADRMALVWLSPVEGPLPEGALETASAAVTALLDRKDDGDNENPRQAGRDAYEALQCGPEKIRLAVIQLFDAFERVKYFRAGWKQPISLGNRGVKSDGIMQFDEGGEATVHEGHRLFFPGCLEYEGEHNQAEQLAMAWNGGKASRLYEAMFTHWKTKKSAPALEAFARAAVSDVPSAELSGLALVTGVS